MPNAVGACYISPHVLAESLPLPIDTEILGAEWDNDRKELLLLFRHKDAPKPAPAAGLAQTPIPMMTCAVHVEAREATAYDRIVTRVSQWVRSA